MISKVFKTPKALYKPSIYSRPLFNFTNFNQDPTRQQWQPSTTSDENTTDHIVPKVDSAGSMKQRLETMDNEVSKFIYESPSGDRISEILEKGTSFTGATGPHKPGEHEVPPGIADAHLIDYDADGKSKSQNQFINEGDKQFLNEERKGSRDDPTIAQKAEETTKKASDKTSQISQKANKLAEKIGDVANTIFRRK